MFFFITLSRIFKYFPFEIKRIFAMIWQQKANIFFKYIDDCSSFIRLMDSIENVFTVQFQNLKKKPKNFLSLRPNSRTEKQQKETVQTILNDIRKCDIWNVLFRSSAFLFLLYIIISSLLKKTFFLVLLRLFCPDSRFQILLNCSNEIEVELYWVWVLSTPYMKWTSDEKKRHNRTIHRHTIWTRKKDIHTNCKSRSWR